MPIEKKHTGKRFVDYVGEIAQNKRNAAIAYLTKIGIDCVAEARKSGSYTDRTGNLRSSIGYCIVENGSVITKSGFEKVSSTASQGKQAGEKSLSDLIAEYSKGLVLIVVAGMNYAVYVEARGFNVLDSARTEGKKQVETMKQKLGIK